MPQPKKETTAKTAPPAEKVGEPLLTADDFTRDPSHAIPMAGLLASDPDLATARLTEGEWEARFHQYMTSERP